MLQDIPRSLQESGLQEAAVRQLTSCTPLLTSGRLLGIGGLANCTVSTVIIGLLVDFPLFPCCKQSVLGSEWGVQQLVASCFQLLGIGAAAGVLCAAADISTAAGHWRAGQLHGEHR